MLVYEPSKRATAAECLRHPWLAGRRESEESLKDDQIEHVSAMLDDFQMDDDMGERETLM